MLNSNQIENDDPLLFEIISAHICEPDGPEKKHVMYTLRVRHAFRRDDSAPATITRRYTHFLNLYTTLCRDFPELLKLVQFPKKALMGNFDNKLIASRSTGFESLLKIIISNNSLRTSQALLVFLQEPELNRVKRFISDKQYSLAVPLLENNFVLLNNVYMDRSPAVLLALCRLLGCVCAVPGSKDSPKWADLALHRFDGVSDSDLLVLYIPLLHVCIKIWWEIGRDKAGLEQRLDDLKRQGINNTDNISLLDAVTKAELKITGI